MTARTPFLVLASTLAMIAASPSAAIGMLPGGQSGLDMILVDADAMPQEPEQAQDQPSVEDISWSGAPVDLLKPTHHLYTDLRRQLTRYQLSWSSLPQVRVPAKGGPLQPGATNDRVSALRERLGLVPDGAYDEELQDRISRFQRAHGLRVENMAGGDTLAALNRGASHYERKLLLNLERARRLPAPETVQRYILVDAGAAKLWMYENGRPVDSMKVIVGSPKSATPMLAALMRYANVNPYWNVPPDLVASLIAPRVLSGGTSYLSERGYEVLDGWEEAAKVIDPATVDWRAVAEGKLEQRVRQLPGGSNSMGTIKYMLPNEFGIYLHDTPNKALFAEEYRWLSNGCVRLEDADRLAKWIFGAIPRSSRWDREDYLELNGPLPVYITYLTANESSVGALFRADPYERDAPVLARFADASDGMRDARPPFRIDLKAGGEVTSSKSAASSEKAGSSKKTASAVDRGQQSTKIEAGSPERKKVISPRSGVPNIRAQPTGRRAGSAQLEGKLATASTAAAKKNAPASIAAAQKVASPGPKPRPKSKPQTADPVKETGSVRQPPSRGQPVSRRRPTSSPSK